MKPDGVFLSNGPGDPAATGKYAIGIIKTLIKKEMPIFGICLGRIFGLPPGQMPGTTSCDPSFLPQPPPAVARDGTRR